MNPTGCHNPEHLFKITDKAKIEDPNHKPVILMSSDGCSFPQKARNVELAGGAVALIYYKNDKDLEDVIMSDDGSG
jgi:hypothetical protein